MNRDNSQSPSDASSPAASPSFRIFKRALIGGAIAALAYALAIGPAVFLAQRRVVSGERVAKLFFPVWIIQELVPGGDWLMDRYVGMWASLTPDPAPESAPSSKGRL